MQQKGEKLMKIKCNSTGNEFDLPLEECQRLYLESPHEFTVLDEKFVPPSTETPSTIAQRVLGTAGNDNGNGAGNAGGSTVKKDEKPADPYAEFKMADFTAELEKRGIDPKECKDNKERKARLEKDDADKKAQAEADALAFEALKLEAETLEVPVEAEDTLETLQAKVEAKKNPA